jgi:mevalonate kinase
MLITGRISPPSDSSSSASLGEPDRLSKSLADAVNVYAFLSEKILHGNPSGVDNSVAVYGGGLLYTKSIPSEGKEGGMVPIAGYVIRASLLLAMVLTLQPRFTSHRFLLTDTRVPRNTKELVGSVGKLKIEEPGRVGKILDGIQRVVEKASHVLSGSAGTEDLEVRHPFTLAPLSLMPTCRRP